ncbi:hypothetical protein [Lonepinella sp. BR2930]|uniref:hypothetical protein n=1 Tax=Lonepinella sp. BR2930 TaxID=3434554 RepID=UPI003F6E34B5
MYEFFINIILAILNISFCFIACFLIWIYYKWDQYNQLFLTLSGLVLYQAIFFEISQFSNKIILSILCTLIIAKITYDKCKKIANNYKKKRFEEMLKDFEQRQRLEKFNAKIR